MKKIYPILFILVVFGRYTFAQTQSSGNVIDAVTNEKLPFVNVGIIGKGIGTVTNNDGNFILNLPANGSDSLRISMVGYVPQSFLVADLAERASHLNIKLVPAVNELKEVKVKNRKWKTAILGNTTKSQNKDIGVGTNRLGDEIGAIIKIKRSPTWLKQFNASIVESAGDTVRLRLNIYSIKDGLPDKNLLQDNIITTVRKGDRQITINLDPYNIVVDDNFLISLETIQNISGRGLMFSASLLSSALIARETSQAKWVKIGIVGVGFNVLAEY
jgi:hypothetical protein